MMPNETNLAIQWALTQTYIDENSVQQTVTKDTAQPLVDNVRKYFNTNNILYTNFSFSDLQTYL